MDLIPDALVLPGIQLHMCLAAKMCIEVLDTMDSWNEILSLKECITPSLIIIINYANDMQPMTSLINYANEF